MASEEKKTEKTPSKFFGLSPLILLFTAINLVATLGSFSYILYTYRLSKPEELMESMVTKKILNTIKNTSSAKDIHIFTLPKMNINLRTPKGTNYFRYANITVALRCNNSKCLEDLEAIRVKVEDLVQTIISQKNHLELNNSESTVRLKYDITRKVNEILRKGMVTETYFSNYIIQ